MSIYGPARLTRTAVIANGATVSNAIDCSYGALVAIQSPATFDAVNISFQGSVDGGTTYCPIYYSDGTLYSVTVGALSAATAFAIDYTKLIGFQYIKLVASGAVAAERTWVCVVRNMA